MIDPSPLSLLHRELFIWLARRNDVRSVSYSRSEFVIAPMERLREDGSPWPTLVRVRISLNEFASAWPELVSGSRALELDAGTDLSEVGVFSLLDVHLDEAVNSLREPGPYGYEYSGGSFRAQ